MKSFLRMIFKILFFFSITLNLYSQTEEQGKYTSKIKIDWKTGTIELLVESKVGNSSYNLTKEKYIAETEADKLFNELLLKELSPIAFDSFRSFKDVLKQDLFTFYNAAETNKVKKYCIMSQDLKKIQIKYELKLFPHIISLFIEHNKKAPYPKVLSWEPSSQYSGILIYAKGEIQVQGEKNKVKLIPCLIPKIYDEDMNLILNAEKQEPEILKTIGPLGYTDSIEDKAIKDRTGMVPLKITAYKIYGKNYTDIIISREDAKKILGNENNQKLISEGKVIVICDL